MTYPRTTLAAIAAALAGTAGSVVIGLSLLNAAMVGQTITPGSISVNSGKTLAYFSSATGSIDAAVVPNGTCAILGTVAVTGAQASSTSPGSVSIGYDPVFKSGYATSVNVTGWVSSYGTVSVQGCAGTSTAMSDPPALVFRATVTNFNP